MRVLVLEDEQYRRQYFAEQLARHDLTFALDAGTAIERLQREQFDAIFLDHDLGPGDGTGQDVALAVALMKSPPPVWIHSYNMPGARAISGILAARKVRHQRIPFGPSLIENFRMWSGHGEAQARHGSNTVSDGDPCKPPQ